MFTSCTRWRISPASSRFVPARKQRPPPSEIAGRIPAHSHSSHSSKLRSTSTFSLQNRPSNWVKNPYSILISSSVRPAACAFFKSQNTVDLYNLSVDYNFKFHALKRQLKRISLTHISRFKEN